MHTENFVFRSFVADTGSKWHVLEHVVHLLEHTVWIGDVFLESLRAFLSESEILVHITVLVVSSQQEDLLRVLELQRNQ